MIYNWKKIVRHGIPLLTLCVFIEIFAGQILQSQQETLIKLSIFLISIPVINGVGGNIGSVLGARLASGLHVGYISIDLKDKKMQESLFTSISIGIALYFVLAVIIYLVSSFINRQVGISPMKFISIVLGAGVLLVCVISFVSVFTAFWSFKMGLDPDDTVAPVVTTVGDTLGITFLFLLIGVVGI
ncbi:MAG: magnesium transporter [Thermoplasmatales archaeon]|nr:MAG: magnesium transporter [Thermoplasmatales archaeon]